MYDLGGPDHIIFMMLHRKTTCRERIMIRNRGRERGRERKEDVALKLWFLKAFCSWFQSLIRSTYMICSWVIEENLLLFSFLLLA